MIKREEGFTLVELMITMVVFVLVIAAASSIFSSLLNQFKQQSKIIEANIEGVVGLEMLRADVQQAGYGLPWSVDSNGDDVYDAAADSWNLNGYNEAAGANNNDPTDPSYYNDGDTPSAIPVPAMQRAPRSILAHNDAGPVMPTGLQSDYLVVKAASIGLGDAAQKWTYITNNGPLNIPPRVWNINSEDLQAADMVIVERPVMNAGRHVLVMAAPPTFATTFATVFQPQLSSFDTHLVYGISTVKPRSPFNRADFYVATPPAGMPARCAPNTGILYKAVMNHADGGFTALPLLDCVADMQVVFINDPNDPNNPTVPPQPPVLQDANFPYTMQLTAEQIRSQITGVAVYVLTHEGQRDPNFTFNNFSTGCGVPNCMIVGPDTAVGRPGGFNLSLIGPDFANYRWKVYQFDVQLLNFK